MLMPEAAVDKECDHVFLHDDIRIASYFPVMQSEAEPKAVKFFSDGNFRSSVFGSDSAHI